MSTDSDRTETSGGRRDQDLIAGARAQEDLKDGRAPVSPTDETKIASPASVQAVVGESRITLPGYLLKRKLSGGGQGVVYEAIQESTKRRVAVKIIRGGPVAHPENKKRLERGVRVLGQLHHPNIVGIIDSGSVAGCMYYVMEYVAGVTLDDYIAQQRATSFELNAPGTATGSGSRSRGSKAELRAERQSMHRLLTVFAKICEGLDAAHVKGVLHRDIKPANILIDARGEPHLLDFDLAKILDGGFLPDEEFSAMTVTGEFLGSLRWASPEQVERKPSGIDLRTDVYSLGVVMFEMLTGQFPYPVVGTRREIEDNILHAVPQKPRTIRRAIDDELETIVLKCLSKEPARRYRSAGDLAGDVRSYLNGDPISAKRDSGWYMLKKLASRHRATTTVAACVLAILLSSLTYVFFAWRYAEKAVKKMEAAQAQASITAKDIEDVSALAVEANKAAFAKRTEAMFLWFLAEWEAGQLDRAKQAAMEFGTRDPKENPRPEALAIAYLLGEIDEDAFGQAAPESSELLAAFTRAEMLRRENRGDEALRLYNACRELEGPVWLKREAADRRSRVGQDNTNEPDHGSEP